MTQVSSLAAFHLFRSNNKLTFAFFKVCLTRRTLSFQQDKIILQIQAQKFYTNIIRNSAPTLKTYVDDMHTSLLKTSTSSSSPNLQFKSSVLDNTFKVPRTKQLLAIESPPNFPITNCPNNR